MRSSFKQKCAVVAAALAFPAMLHAALRHSCRSVRYSLFYEPNMDEVAKLSAARVRYAERLLQRLAGEKAEEAEEGENGRSADETGESRCTKKTFCVGVVGTEKRLDHRYLLQSVGSLRGIGGVGADCRTDKFFVQLRRNPLRQREEPKEDGVHADVRLMQDAGIDFHFVKSPYRLGEAYMDDAGVRKTYILNETRRGKMQWFSDEADDYRRALDRCLAESPTSPYVMILEEDLFATRDLMGKLSSAVDFLESEHRGGWSSLKLFVTEFWQNWEREPTDVALLLVGGVLFSCLCELLVTAFLLAVLERRRPARERHDESWLLSLNGMDSSSDTGFQQELHVEIERGAVVEDCKGRERKRRTKDSSLCSHFLSGDRVFERWIWILRVYFCCVGIATMLAVSKQALNLSRVSRRGIYADNMGAHSLGMVFPRHTAEELVSFLDKTEMTLPLDVLLLRFGEEVVGGGQDQFIIVPSLVQHTGMISSSEAKVQIETTLGEVNYYRNYFKVASKFDDLRAEDLDGY